MIKLNVLERIKLLTVLPTEGNLLEMRMLRDLKNKLFFTEEEIKEFGLQVQAERYTWKKNESVGFEFTLGEIDIIKKSLRGLIEKKKVTEELVSLFDVFHVE